MRATLLYGPGDIRVDEVPDPVVALPTDAVVKVVSACVCGSDLWGYRGVVPTPRPRRIGHEFVGIVEEVGAEVTRIRVGDFVIAPFYACDGTCPNCRNGFSSACQHIAWWGGVDEHGVRVDAGQGEYVRVPMADGTLTATPGVPDDALIPSLLTLSDVYLTGHHAAISAEVGPGSTVAVVGDGAVGLSAVLAAAQLGADRIVAMSRHEDRAALARAFGATDVVAERGDDGIAALKDLFDGIGPDAVLECVGTKDAMDAAIGGARPGGRVGFVGVPHLNPELPTRRMFDTNVSVRGGIAPVRSTIDAVLPSVLDGTIEPGLVFTATYDLDHVADAYAAMDERRAIKAMVRP